MPSFAYNAVYYLCKFANYRSSLEDLEVIKNDSLADENQPQNIEIPAILTDKFTCDTFITEKGGWKFFAIRSSQANQDTKTILYIHGGNFVKNLEQNHWNLVNYYMQNYNCAFIIPMYPLSPQNCFDKTYEGLCDIYSKQGKLQGFNKMILMGDNAGGNICLTLCLYIKEKQLTNPGAVVLLCPILDLSMSHGEIIEKDYHDVLHSKKGVQNIGLLWAGANTSVKDWKCSPIYGNLSGLPEILVVAAQDDITEPDTRYFQQLAQSKKSIVNIICYPHMFHNFMMSTYLHESEVCHQDIIRYLNEKFTNIQK